MTPVSVFAPAKINLFLHIRGRRADGYHLLESLVAFADIGDRVTVAPAERTSLTITGPFAIGLDNGDDNLVVRAARLSPTAPVRIALEKNLPLASGIGGGSSDAAATAIAISRLTNQPIPDLLKLGADIPVCLRRRPTLMSGIGEILADVPPLPDTPVLLVNPGTPLPTADVFRAFSGPFSPAPAIPPAGFETPQALSAFLTTSDNALTLAAIARVGAIADVLQVIQRQQNCLLSRLSGSGATCFGLFPDVADATQAARIIGKMRPNWWVAHGHLKAFTDGVT